MSDDGVLRAVLLVFGLIVLLPLLWMGSMLVFGSTAGIGGHMAPGGGWVGLFGLVPLLLFVALAYLLYSALRDSDDQNEDPAIEELRAAYARGELTDEEFEHRRERLREDR